MLMLLKCCISEYLPFQVANYICSSCSNVLLAAPRIQNVHHMMTRETLACWCFMRSAIDSSLTIAKDFALAANGGPAQAARDRQASS